MASRLDTELTASFSARRFYRLNPLVPEKIVWLIWVACGRFEEFPSRSKVIEAIGEFIMSLSALVSDVREKDGGI